jgi:hypothetical protein
MLGTDASGLRSGRGLYLAVAGLAVLVVVGGAVLCVGAASTGARSTVAVLFLFGLWAGVHLLLSELCSGRRRFPRAAAGSAAAVPTNTVAAHRVRPPLPKRRAYPVALAAGPVFRAGV